MNAMKALTLQQPWASFVARGVKTIETRSWDTQYRGPLAIHAACSWSPHWLEWMDPDDWRCTALDEINVDLDEDCNGSGWYRPRRRDLPLGSVVATCILVGVAKIGHAPNGGWTTDDGSFWNLEPQRPYGDFTPGRYAWLLSDVVALPNPAPARGRQRLWNWDAAGVQVPAEETR